MWRAPRRRDDTDWIALLAAADAVDGRGESYGPDEIDEEWAAAGIDPLHEATFCWAGGELVAFGWVRVLTGTSGHRLELWGAVHPRMRGRGLGAELLDRQLAGAAHARDRLAVSGRSRVALHCLHTQPALARLARDRGLVHRRSFVDLGRDLGPPVTPPEPPPGIRLIGWDPSLDDAVRVAHNEAFADHWGSEARDPARWRDESTGHRSFRPDLSAIALATGPGPLGADGPVPESGPEVAGYLLAGTFPADWPAAGHPQAWVQTLGVRRRWRRRGVGAALLGAALSAMGAAADGFAQALVGVDAQNATGAPRLYRRAGFGPLRRVDLYEGPVPGGRARGPHR